MIAAYKRLPVQMSVSDVFLSSDGKLFHADGSVPEKLQVQSSGRCCDQITKIRGSQMTMTWNCWHQGERWNKVDWSGQASTGICRPEDRSWSQLFDSWAASVGHREELVWWCPVSIFWQPDQLLPVTCVYTEFVNSWWTMTKCLALAGIAQDLVSVWPQVVVQIFTHRLVSHHLPVLWGPI